MNSTTQHRCEAKTVLLHCLRQHVRGVRLYHHSLEMVGTALSSGCIGTGEAMQLLVQLDGAACLDAVPEKEPERRAA